MLNAKVKNYEQQLRRTASQSVAVKSVSIRVHLSAKAALAMADPWLKIPHSTNSSGASSISTA
jgi:hypothetical protein